MFRLLVLDSQWVSILCLDKNFDVYPGTSKISFPLPSSGLTSRKPHPDSEPWTGLGALSVKSGKVKTASSGTSRRTAKSTSTSRAGKRSTWALISRAARKLRGRCFDLRRHCGRGLRIWSFCEQRAPSEQNNGVGNHPSLL